MNLIIYSTRLNLIIETIIFQNYFDFIFYSLKRINKLFCCVNTDKRFCNCL